MSLMESMFVSFGFNSDIDRSKEANPLQNYGINL